MDAPPPPTHALLVFLERNKRGEILEDSRWVSVDARQSLCPFCASDEAARIYRSRWFCGECGKAGVVRQWR